MKHLRNFFLTLTVPFAKLISWAGKPEPRRSHEDYVRIRNLIRPGDLLLTREDYRMSNVIIPGFWSHVAICVGNRFDGMIMEAVPPKVRKVHLDEFVMSVDSIALLRPRFEIKHKDLSKDYVGARYNFALFWRHSWVCSRLVGDYFRRIIVAKRLPFKMRKTFGIVTGTPQDFYNDHKNFKIMYEVR